MARAPEELLHDEGHHEEEEEEDEDMEERSLDYLQGSEIDRELSSTKSRKRGSKKKHKLKWMKRPMTIPDIILEFLEEELRESALRALSSFLVERRKEDPNNYGRTGFLLLNSCATMSILLQEILGFYPRMDDGTLNPRSMKRLTNVLTLFQCVAANSETRQKFVDCRVPNFLIPIILFQSDSETFDNIRAISLSVIGILCQGQDTNIIAWALENDMVKVCCTVIEIGNELSKVIALHILEAILRNQFGIGYMCHHLNEHRLKGFTETLNQTVALLAENHDFSPRLLFHIIRCYVILCTNPRGLSIVVEILPDDITYNSFHEVTEEFPVIRNLLDRLLLCVGKFEVDPIPQENLRTYQPEEKVSMRTSNTKDAVFSDLIPLKLDLNKEKFLPFCHFYRIN